MSWVEDAREALADAIEALPAFAGVNVIREWIPEVDRDELEGRQVHIAPLARRTRLASRSCKITAIDVSVAIIDPFEKAGTEAAQASSAHDLADAIIDGLLGKRFGTTRLMCISAEQTVTTSVEHWREKRMFATFLNLTLET